MDFVKWCTEINESLDQFNDIINPYKELFDEINTLKGNIELLKSQHEQQLLLAGKNANVSDQGIEKLLRDVKSCINKTSNEEEAKAMKEENQMLKASIETLTNENKELKKSIEKSNEDNIVLKQEMDAINHYNLTCEEMIKKLNFDNSEKTSKVYRQQEEIFSLKKRLSAAPLQNQSPKQQPSNNTEKETNVTQMKEVAIENVAKGMEALKLKEESMLPTNLTKQFAAQIGEIYSLKHSTDGLSLLASGENQNVIIYDYNGTAKQRLRGSSSSVYCAVQSIRGDVLGCCGDNSVLLWGPSGNLKLTLTGHSGGVRSGSFFGERAVTGSADRFIKIWDLSKGYCISTLIGMSGCISLKTIRDSSIVSLHLDKTLRWWSKDSRQPVHVLPQLHIGTPTGVSVSDDGDMIATIGRDNQIKIIDTRMVKVRSVLERPGFVVGSNFAQAVFSPTSHRVGAGSEDGKLTFWDTETGKVVKIVTSDIQKTPIGPVLWSNFEARFVAAGKNVVNIWE